MNQDRCNIFKLELQTADKYIIGKRLEKYGIEPRPFMEVLKLPLSWVTPDASDASFAGQEPGSRATHVEHSIL